MTHTLPRARTMYAALLRKDPSFEGIFVVGVKTTGVFCRPTCRARKPKLQNVEFFGTARDALQRGYRPCKICTPMAYRGNTPEWIRPLIDDLGKNGPARMKDSDLRKKGLDPARVRNWFKRHHGMTFQAYLRALRIGEAFGRIKYGDGVAATAFDSGYESLSGFTDSFKRMTGTSPGKSNDRRMIPTTRILTPLGPMLAAATEEGICLLEFVDRRMLETQLKRLGSLLKGEFVPGTSPHFKALNGQLEEYFAGTRKQFDLPLVLKGTPFQEKVWEGLRSIPYGSTRSYKAQSESLRMPKAVRAVARANGENRIAIVIPCHRVIGMDGKLVGYGGGLWRKKWLLNLELDGPSAARSHQGPLFAESVSP